jgi:hypothetical protein
VNAKDSRGWTVANFTVVKDILRGDVPSKPAPASTPEVTELVIAKPDSVDDAIAAFLRGMRMIKPLQREQMESRHQNLLRIWGAPEAENQLSELSEPEFAQSLKMVLEDWSRMPGFTQFEALVSVTRGCSTEYTQVEINCRVNRRPEDRWLSSDGKVRMFFSAYLCEGKYCSVLRKVDAQRGDDAVAQALLDKGADVNDAQSAKTYRERDNVGTRYETADEIKAYSLARDLPGSMFSVETIGDPRVLAPPPKDPQAQKIPFIYYYFYVDPRDGKADAIAAMTELPCLKIATDSGKLISTEVLDFGLYPNLCSDGSGKIDSWTVFIGGAHLSLELYEAAINSFKKHQGNEKRVSGPPAPSKTSQTAAGMVSASEGAYTTPLCGLLGLRPLPGTTRSTGRRS